MHKITKKELKFVLILSLLIISSTFIPIIYGYIITPENMKFMGLIHVVDSNTYFDYMNQAREGHFFFVNSYTSEPMAPFMIRPLFWFMGLFTIFLHPLFVWYLFKVVLGFVFLISAYYLISMVIEDSFTRKISFVFLCISSGFGFFLKMFNLLGGKLFGGTIDLRMQSAITFLSLNGQPHTIFSLLLIVLTYIFFLKAIEKNSLRFYSYSGLSSLLLGFVHSFDLITVFMVIMLFLVIIFIKNKKIILKPLIFFCAGVIPILYYAFLLLFNPIFKEWNKQNIIESPNPWGYILGYGLLFIFVLLFFIRWYSWENLLKAKYPLILVISWVFVNPFLLYSPLKIEARFVEGLHIPIIILASLGFVKYVLPYFKTYKRLIIASVLIIISSSNIYWIYSTINNTNPYFEPTNEFTNKQYLSDNEIEALQWLKSNTNKETVLSGYYIGNYIPRISGNKVFLGHWAQTIDFEKKQEIVKQFFQQKKENYKKTIVSKYGIDYVYYGKEEQDFGKIEENNFLVLVYENKNIKIYKIDL